MTFSDVIVVGMAFLCSTVLVSSQDIKAVNNTIACGPEQPLVVTQQLGFLTSPDFDNFHYYPASKNCSWTLKAPEGKALVLKKMYFGLNWKCNTNVLYVFDGEPPNHKKIGQYCGYRVPLRFKSESNILYLNFISGRAPRDVGFQFFFEQVDKTVLCKDNEITCQHRTKCLPLHKKCDGNDDCGDGTDEEKCDSVSGNNNTKVECGIPKVKPFLEDYRRKLERTEENSLSRVYRVVGGRGAVPWSWPWQVSLRLPVNEPYGHKCGGVLINRQWVLTAGHCFKNELLNVKVWNVLFGKHLKLIPEGTEQVRYMEAIHIHPLYKGLTGNGLSVLMRKQHDIALVKLNAPVTITDYVIPVCIPPANYTLSPGTLCYVTGWGETYNTGFELELKQAVVPIVSREQCGKWYGILYIPPSMVCAGYSEGGQDSCQGDSGGPLVYSNDNQSWSLAGIASTGGPICGEKEQPGIYTSVPYYVDWIADVILKNT